MKDRYGREVSGLRISVTEKCNLNCFYCHREGCPPATDEISVEELALVASVAREFGMTKFKLTGGEPLLRKDITEIVEKISRLGVDDLSLTTNGVLLASLADGLAKSGLMRVNISLDTLDEDKFRRITGVNALGEVIRGIDAAMDAGLNPIKLNMVLLTGINDNEVDEMISFASEHGAILQIVELIELNGKDFEAHHGSLHELERKLEKQAKDVQTRSSMHARKRYVLPEGVVEIVRPMHNTEFCSHCTRLRLTSDGMLKPCLMRNDNLVDIRGSLFRRDVEEVKRRFLLAIERREPFFKGSFSACSL